MQKALKLTLALATCFITSQTAWSASYPERAVKIIVPQAPGGASDALARLMAQELGAKWGQPVVVENKAGGGGNIGLDAAAKSAGDGYTLLFTYEGTQAINVSLRDLPFDPIKDFTPIASVATVPFIVTLNRDMKVNSFQDFISLSSATDTVTYGSAGSGTVNHLLGEMLNLEAGTRLTHIPYKGAAPALNDLFGGRINAVFTSVPSIASHVDAGTVKALAITSNQRSSRFPDIPTIAESGYPNFHVAPWFGIFGPANVPQDIVDKINADVTALLDTDKVKETLAQQAAEPLKTTPAELKKMLIDDIEKWRVTVEKSGARVD